MAESGQIRRRRPGETSRSGVTEPVNYLDSADRRWDVESDFKSIKDTLGAGVLGCCTPEMVTKELAVHLLGYNLIRLLMCEAAATADLEPRQMSLRHTQQLWCAWVRQGAPLDEGGW